MAPWIKALVQKACWLKFSLQNPWKKLDAVVHIYNPSTPKARRQAETGELSGSLWASGARIHCAVANSRDPASVRKMRLLRNCPLIVTCSNTPPHPHRQHIYTQHIHTYQIHILYIQTTHTHTHTTYANTTHIPYTNSTHTLHTQTPSHYIYIYTMHTHTIYTLHTVHTCYTHTLHTLHTIYRHYSHILNAHTLHTSTHTHFKKI